MNLSPAASFSFFRVVNAFVVVAVALASVSFVSAQTAATPVAPAAAVVPTPAPADRAAVIEAYGPPVGTMRVGEREILSYPERKVVIVEGRVVSSTATPPAPVPRPTPTPAPAPDVGRGVGAGNRSTVPTPLPLQPGRDAKRAPTPVPTRYYPARPTPLPSPQEAMLAAGQNFIQVTKGSGRLYYDPQVWREMLSPNAEMKALSHRSVDLHVIMKAQAGNFALSDTTSMLVGQLRAREPQAQVLRQERRNVKGGEVTFLRALGSPAPSRLEYVYFIHGGTRFATVFMTVGPQTVCEQNAADIAKLLEGFEIPDADEGK